MSLLSSLVPWQVYGIIAALALAGAGSWYYLHNRHEQSIGESKIVRQDKKAATVAETKVVAGEAVAQTEETQNALIFEKAVVIPAVDDVGLLCRSSVASVSSNVPAAGAVATSGTGEHSADSGSGPTFDPSKPLLDRAAEADAEIAWLQGRVHELEKQMNDGP